MPGYLVAALLFAALLHAGWNAAIRGGQDKTLATVLVAGGSGCLALAALPFVAPPARACLPWLAASAMLQLAYYALIAMAYRDGGMGFVYPLMRGTAVVLVAVAGHVLSAQALSPGQVAGIGVLCAGIMAQAMGHRATGRAGLYAVGNAVVIAAYTILDSVGVRRAQGVPGYTLLLFAVTGLPVLAWGMASRGREIRRLLWNRPSIACLGGIGTLGSYGIVLWALTISSPALVAALRETSILFAILIGVVCLGERIGRRNGVAIGLIVVGAVLVRLG